MNFLIQLAIFAVTTVLNEYLRPNPFKKANRLDEFDFPTAEETRPVTYLCGTAKLAGNTAWDGDFKSVAVKSRPSGWFFLGLAGLLLPKVATGRRNYVGFMLSLCLGPIDAVREIFFGEKSVWTGNVSGGSITIDKKDLYGGEKDGGRGGIKFIVDVLQGTYTQTVNSYLQSVTGTPCPAYRGIFSLIFRGPSGGSGSGWIGSNSTQVDPVYVVATRYPLPVGYNASYKNISSGDGNPIYSMVEWFTDQDFGAGIPSAKMGASWQAEAAIVHGEELGVSFVVDTSRPCEDVIFELLKTVDGTFYTDLATGLIEIKLTRADYNVADLLVLDETNVRSLAFSKGSRDETTNEITVPFIDRLNGFVESPGVPSKDNANRISQEAAISTSIGFLGVSTAVNSDRLANRAVTALSAELGRATITLDQVGLDLIPGQCFVLNWSADPKIEGLVMRVGKRRPGTFADPVVTIEAVEDVFQLEPSGYALPVSSWVNPIQAATLAIVQAIAERPYIWTRSDEQFIDAYAARVNASAFGYDLYLSETGSAGAYELKEESAEWTPTGTLYQDYQATTSAVDASGTLIVIPGADMTELANRAAAEVARGNNILRIVTGGVEEILAFESFTINGAGNYVFSNVWRGQADTLPQKHLTGDRVWFLSEGRATPADAIKSTSTPHAKIAPRSASGVVDYTTATALTLTLAKRALRPYAPRGFRINGSFSTTTTPATGDVALAWYHADRTKQFLFLKHDDATSVVESELAVRYKLKIYGDANALSPRVIDLDELTLAYTYTNAFETADFGALQGALTFVLYATRNGLDSYQAWRRVVTRPSGTAPASLPTYTSGGTYTAPPAGNAAAIGGVKLPTSLPTAGGPASPVYDPTSGTWSYVSGAGIARDTESATAADAHTASNIYEAIKDQAGTASLEVSATMLAGATILCFFSAELEVASADDFVSKFRFVLDGATYSPELTLTRPGVVQSGERIEVSFHRAFTAVSAGARTVGVQWSSGPSDVNVTFYTRQLSIIGV